MNENPFIRYLVSKKSIDDRSLSEWVWRALVTFLPPAIADRPLKILDVGAGTGTMLQRILERDLLTYAQYTLVDANPALLAYGLDQLLAWAAKNGYAVTVDGQAARLYKTGRQITAVFTHAEALSFVRQSQGSSTWDLVIAHAFLDLVDLEQAVPALLSALNGNGLFYTTLNFDGLTILEPPIDPAFDDLIQNLYHQTMDQRRIEGQPSGDSRTGRHLFSLLRRQGAQILAAGASDWVVFPGPQGYPLNEVYFLHFIIETIDNALRQNPGLDPDRFQTWVQERYAQIERKELVYIAHQVDILAKPNRGIS